MRVSRFALLAVLVAPGVGCSCPPRPAAADVKPVAPPAELVGKWRFEQKEGGHARVSVYNVLPDGFIEIDVHTTTPDREFRVRTKSAITQVEGDKLTVAEISQMDEDGVEDALTAERRQPRAVQYRVAGNELHWGRGNAAPLVLTRVKD